MNFASLRHCRRLANEKDDDILTPDQLNMPNGAFPLIILLTSPQCVSDWHNIFQEEQSPRLSNNERETLARDNTRKLYLAATGMA